MGEGEKFKSGEKNTYHTLLCTILPTCIVERSTINNIIASLQPLIVSKILGKLLWKPSLAPQRQGTREYKIIIGPPLQQNISKISLGKVSVSL